MRAFLLALICFSFFSESMAQHDDFIVLRKRNNRTLKTYREGSFLSARTNTGYQLNGFIKAIRNDSIFLRQQETRLVSTEFGQTVDTVFHTFGIDYRNISAFYFEKQFDPIMRKRGFTQVVLPTILVVGGTGFIVLELVNTIYRKESLTADGKLVTLGIAAGVAGTGLLLSTLNKRRNDVGNRYKVFYVKKPHVK